MLVSDPVDTGLVPPAAKRRRLDHDDGELTNYHDEETSEGGGFLVDDELRGFLQGGDDESGPAGSRHDALGLSMIPTAVRLTISEDIPITKYALPASAT